MNNLICSAATDNPWALLINAVVFRKLTHNNFALWILWYPVVCKEYYLWIKLNDHMSFKCDWALEIQYMLKQVKNKIKKLYLLY